MLDELIGEARGWLADCGLPNSKAVTQADVIRTVHKFYDGGWEAFVEADQSLDKSVVWLLMVRRFSLDFANSMFPE